MRQVVSVLAWAALLSIVSIPISGEAQTKSDDFPLEGVEERRTLTVESTYLFSTQAYRALTDLVKPKRVDTPEATLFFHFDAMRRGDYESFLKTWTSESVAEMNERNRIQQRDRAFWLEKWAKVYPDAKVQLLHRLVYRKFVLIEYRLIDKTGKKLMDDTVALRQEGGGWKLTQELKNEPLLFSWNEPTRRVRIPPDSMFFGDVKK